MQFDLMVLSFQLVWFVQKGGCFGTIFMCRLSRYKLLKTRYITRLTLILP